MEIVYQRQRVKLNFYLVFACYAPNVCRVGLAPLSGATELDYKYTINNGDFNFMKIYSQSTKSGKRLEKRQIITIA